MFWHTVIPRDPNDRYSHDEHIIMSKIQDVTEIELSFEVRKVEYGLVLLNDLGYEHSRVRRR